MRASRLPLATLVLLAACGGRVDGTPSAQGAAVAPPSAPPPSGTHAPPVPGVDACPDVVAIATDCGPFADPAEPTSGRCDVYHDGNVSAVRPIAVGTFATLGSLAVSDDAVYWTASRSALTPSCSGAIYRTPMGAAFSYEGGSEKVVSGRQLGVMAVDATTLYWSEAATGAPGWSYHSLQGKDELVIGKTPGHPSPEDPDGTYVWPVSGSPLGVFFHTHDAILRAHPASLEKVADVAFRIGSKLGFDGVSLFAATEPYDTRSPAGGLSRLGPTGAPAVVASRATTRGRATVIAYRPSSLGSTDLFYVTGDDMSVGGMLERPMGIYRVPADGSSPPVALVPPSNEVIDSIALRGDQLYFAVGKEIRVVSNEGAHVVAKLGVPPRDLHANAQGIFFRLDVTADHGGVPGASNVIAWMDLVPVK